MVYWFAFLVAQLFGNYGVAEAVLGAMCQVSQHCDTDEFCYEHQCRNSFCVSQANCQPDEECQYGHVDGNAKFACFPVLIQLQTFNVIDSCPGGGTVIIESNGQPQACNLSTLCSAGNICNPKLGVCCSKLRICKKPRLPEFNRQTNQPLACMQGNNNMIHSCSNGSKCELESGFCCTLPLLNQVCDAKDGCSTDNSKCACNGSNCKCQCLTEFGYGTDATGAKCVRVRRALQETCHFDAECGGAFAECSSAGCRCRSGFERDSVGGCRPLEYRCFNKSRPLFDANGKIAQCMKSPNRTKAVSIDLNRNYDEDFTDDCPSNYYCVPFFDVFDQPNHYQGFCCPNPPLPPAPHCPVGNAHATSTAPNFGCNLCPLDHFCHRDVKISTMEVCCPKPCTSPDDIYVDGQCYAVAHYGEICSVSGQCMGRANVDAIVSDHRLTQPMMCTSGKCTCESGSIEANGRCLKVMCTVGMQGEPTVDSVGQISRCSSSVTSPKNCTSDEICDPLFGVCCKRQNRCPLGYVETGTTCASGYCTVWTDNCYRIPASTQQICCRSK